MAKNKGLIKALATEITTPTAPTNKGAKVYNTRLNIESANDPIQKDADYDTNPNIRHYDIGIHAFKIVDRNPTTAEELQKQRDRNGGETNLEIYKDNVLAAQHLIDISHQSPTSVILIVPAGHTAGQTVRGTDGMHYTKIYGANGELAYVDREGACVTELAAWKATSYTQPNDDLLSDTKKQEITHTFDKDGKLVERTEADRSVQLVLARQDVKYIQLPLQMDMIDRITREVAAGSAQNDPSFTTAAGSGIKTNATPTEPFGAAVSGKEPVKSIMFKNTPATPTPWSQDKAPANEPRLEIGA